MADVKVEYNPTNSLDPIDAPAAPAASIATISASAAVIEDANRVVTVTDKSGRVLGVKRADDALARFRLSRLLKEDAGSEEVMGQAMLTTSIVSINGEVIPFPKSLLLLEALISKIGTPGQVAAMQVQKDEFGFGSRSDVAEEAKN